MDYVYETICEYYGRIIYNAENLWQLDEQSTFIPIPLSDSFPYIISIPVSELEIKKQQYTALEAGNGIGDYDYEEEMDDLNFIFDEAIEAQKDLIITVYWEVYEWFSNIQPVRSIRCIFPDYWL